MLASGSDGTIGVALLATVARLAEPGAALAVLMASLIIEAGCGRRGRRQGPRALRQDRGHMATDGLEACNAPHPALYNMTCGAQRARRLTRRRRHGRARLLAGGHPAGVVGGAVAHADAHPARRGGELDAAPKARREDPRAPAHPIAHLGG